MLRFLRSSKKYIFISALMVLSTLSFQAHAATGTATNKTTGQQYTDDLQLAIDEATSGDILDLTGTFTGSFEIDKKLTLHGASEDNLAILDGLTTGRVLNLSGTVQTTGNQELIAVQLSNLVIQRGYASAASAIGPYGGGILSSYAQLSLSNVIVKNNIADSYGGGIASAGGGVALKNSTFLSNTAGFGGGAVNVTQTPSQGASGIIGCVFKDNSVLEITQGGGALFLTYAAIDIYSSRIVNNSSAGSGGGLFCGDGTTIKIEDTLIKSNIAGYYGGGVFTNGELTIKNSLIRKNTASPYGGGIFNNASGILDIKNSRVINNTASNLGETVAEGGGVFDIGIFNYSNTTIKRNTPNDITSY